MKKATGFLLLMVLLVGLGLGCAAPAPAPAPEPAPAPAPAPEPAPAPAPAPAPGRDGAPDQDWVPPSEPTPPPTPSLEVALDIKGFAFNPAEITIKVGDTVTWTQQDSVSHTTTGDIWDSGNLSQGQTYSKTFDEAGTYDYICTIHPSMKGKVIVE